MTPPNDEALLHAAISLALAAGVEALRIYQTDFDVAAKDDASPVTAADEKGEAIILAGLAKTTPTIPVIAEEAAAAGDLPNLDDPAKDAFFLVDPLDGTKEFIKKTGEFTVNIALIRNGRPVLGVVYAPALETLYAGRAGVGAFAASVDANGALGAERPITARPVPSDGLIAVASRSHRSPETDAFLSDLNVKDFTAAGSSLKFCRLAEGAADVYPRLGRTMEWDTAAGQAVLEAAGGGVMRLDADAPLTYGKVERGYDNPHFVAWGARD
ncbi:MAG: 3'(2'),5'-bisphosphate nucleotidase CysQ [Pseudomonadota bacterium]